jgi:ABC-type lipoprotein release transport system permease subunit
MLTQAIRRNAFHTLKQESKWRNMFWMYLSRELGKRRKQTSLISIGLGVAIALVMVVAGMASGIQTAQSQALSGLYGIGTDITVTKVDVPTPGQFGQRFAFGGGSGNSTGTTQTLSRTRLNVQRGSGTLTSAEVAKVGATSGVADSTATLKLNSVTFSGTLPTFGQGGGSFTRPGAGSSGSASTPSATGQASSNSGRSSFNIDSFSVEGISTQSSKVGPLAGTKVTSGRNLNAMDAGKPVVVLDASYAKTASLSVAKTLSINGTNFDIIGIVKSTGVSATTPSNSYIPIDEAQKLSTETGMFTTVYVKATNATAISSVKADLQKALPKATVSTQSDLASNVSGSLATAANLVDEMGLWLAIIVLLAAFAMSILFTTSGVNRRTRELGTLKAIGWSSRRIVGQVMGESVITGLIGGLFGMVLGLAALVAINAAGPSVSATVSRGGIFGGFGGNGGGGGGFGQRSGGFGSMMSGQGSPFGGRLGGSQNAMNLVLHANIEPWMLVAAIGFALLGGLLAGAIGGLRAAKLSPAQALRSLA